MARTTETDGLPQVTKESSRLYMVFRYDDILAIVFPMAFRTVHSLIVVRVLVTILQELRQISRLPMFGRHELLDGDETGPKDLVRLLGYFPIESISATHATESQTFPNVRFGKRDRKPATTAETVNHCFAHNYSFSTNQRKNY